MSHSAEAVVVRPFMENIPEVPEKQANGIKMIAEEWLL